MSAVLGGKVTLTDAIPGVLEVKSELKCQASLNYHASLDIKIELDPKPTH